MSTPTFHFCEQYSDEWWKLRRGVPTASSFDKIMTPAKRQLSSQCDTLIAELCGELVDPLYPRIGNGTEAMQRGSKMEPESRRFYEFERNVEAKPVGFVLSACGRFGCSPDALVGDDGLLELKNPDPKTHFKYLMGGVLPADYFCQVHGQLIVAQRKWVDFVSYCPGAKPFIIRTEPDDFTKDLKVQLEVFWDKFQKAKARLLAS